MLHETKCWLVNDAITLILAFMIKHYRTLSSFYFVLWYTVCAQAS